ncbi:MAG: hypothetical protein A2Y10_17650 [Planctomycetes bacterium GWF2_41_51]|nr:MAG: hypothetical protein A2Y10_17650 [Planctomycetes bacterium GWF2_41_51]HBG28052.1 hypothetical protein [Phycisphaerales bacterium]
MNFAALKTNRKESGFTLVELLVVISIIAMLLGILMPALSKAKATAVTVLCKTNLKDIGLIATCYANDYGQHLPYTTEEGRWMVVLSDYHYGRAKSTSYTDAEGTKKGGINDFSLFKCPVEMKKTGQTVSSGGVFTPHGMYGMNQFFTGTMMNHEQADIIVGSTKMTEAHNRWRKFSDIKGPATLPLFADTDSDDPRNNADTKAGGKATGCWWLSAKGPHPNAVVKYKWKSKTGWPESRSTSTYGPGPNHNGKTNYLMGDGHLQTTGIWPWRDHIGTDFHPKRNVSILPAR